MNSFDSLINIYTRTKYKKDNIGFILRIVIILDEYKCRNGHTKYRDGVPNICNICGNTEFTLVFKNALEIIKNGNSPASYNYRNKEPVISKGN